MFLLAFTLKSSNLSKNKSNFVDNRIFKNISNLKQNERQN